MQYFVFVMLALSTLSTEGVRREIILSDVKPSSEVFGELLCHSALPIFNLEFADRF